MRESSNIQTYAEAGIKLTWTFWGWFLSVVGIACIGVGFLELSSRSPAVFAIYAAYAGFLLTPLGVLLAYLGGVIAAVKEVEKALSKK